MRDKVFNVVIFKSKIVVTKDGIKTDHESSAYLCNAKDKKDATDWALERANRNTDIVKDYDVEIYVHELKTDQFKKFLNIKNKEIIALENTRDSDDVLDLTSLM